MRQEEGEMSLSICEMGRGRGEALCMGDGKCHRNDAGKAKQVQGVKHLIGNGHRTRQEQSQQTGDKHITINAAVGNRAGELTNIGEEKNR